MKGLAQDEPRDVPAMVDMEDICGICSDWSMETPEDVTGAAASVILEAGEPSNGRPRRRAKRSDEAEGPSSTPSQPPSLAARKGQHDRAYALSPEAAQVAISHARKFPVKVSKKTVREEETVVCAVRRTSDGCFLIQKRPEKGKPAMKEKTRSKSSADSAFCRAPGRVMGAPKSDTVRPQGRLYGGKSQAYCARVCGRALWPRRWAWEGQH